ncbi:hypothetical protein BP5796_06729 [Coleophoma crateriformis]|uniref:Aspergillopepsin-2 n=1 Tax=Coleophoma crateriformis TaxID=565419 RepID=A0A3D8RPN0_9HELO|nr:hypothetical protein BP5796_06729 [Coleophoma crateriformis]
MKFSLALLSTVVLATSALAAPNPRFSKTRLGQRMAARRANNGNGRILEGSTMRSKDSASEVVETKSKKTQATSNSSIQYSENWSGAAITTPPSGQTFNAVSGTFNVPTPSAPSGVASTYSEYAASAWVGIDGNTYSTAILQTGVDFVVDTSGAVSYDAWYEWYPDYAYNFNITISAGDQINASVIATTSTTGTATIENLTTGEVATISLSSTSALGGENAEWIVEDFEEGTSLVALANFGNVTFTDCIAATSQSSEGVSSATIMDIEDTSGNVLTNVALISDSSFSVAYEASTSTSSSSSSSSSGSSSSGSAPGGSSGFGSGSGSSGKSGKGAFGTGKGAFGAGGFRL